MSVKLPIRNDRFLIAFFIFLGILITSLLVCLIFLRHIMTLQTNSAEERFQSYLLVAELRQTSDDLTKMARLYAITGESKYKNYFYEILAIRNGEVRRPINYYQIYWDLVLNGKRPRPDGPPKALKELMLEHGFTNVEFELLESSQRKSDALVHLETRAFEAMEGSNPDSDLAKQLLFGEEYMKAKAEIMAPLQQFMQQVETRNQERTERLSLQAEEIILIAILLAAGSTVVMLVSIFKALITLSKMGQENEMLLLNILPSPIAVRLKGGEEPIADEYAEASVLFSDIVGFTEMTYRLGAKKMVGILNQLFYEFDNLTEQFGIEKIKTIGDNYMAVAGVPVPLADHAIRLADFALAMQTKVAEFGKANELDLKMRIGMNYGNVIAGVIGHKKFIYDLWGDVVNTASRMESTAPQGGIQVTDKMALLLKESFDLEEREAFEVKGKGMMKTFLLKGRK